MPAWQRALPLLAAGVLCACSVINPRVEVVQPTSTRPTDNSRPTTLTGGIFQDAARTVTLFEDRRARNVGDTIIVNINERVQASQTANSKASRTGSVSGTVSSLNKIPFNKGVVGLDVAGEAENTFEGKGTTTADNLFRGSIAVTVVEVLPNGNLLVSGEKQIGINHDVETMRLSGVINPANIVAGNQVNSTQVADARMDFRGKGYISEAQRMGWLSRFFLSVMPF